MDFLLALQNLRSPAADAFFLVITKLGEELFVLVPLLLFYWCLDKKTGLRIGFIYFAGGLVNQFAKILFRVERPFVRDTRLVPQADAVQGATGYSFPSGHTTSATSLASAFILAWWKKWWVWVLSIAYVALVGFSRMYLGVHTPADVLCGIGFTVVMALAVELAWNDCEKNPKHTKVYFLLCAAVTVLMLGYAQTMIAAGKVPPDQAADAFKTGGAAIALLLGVVLDYKFVRFSVEAPKHMQVIKFIVGVTLALILKEGLKYVLGTSLPMQFARYFITVLFVVVGYPWMFTKALHQNREG